MWTTSTGDSYLNIATFLLILIQTFLQVNLFVAHKKKE